MSMDKVVLTVDKISVEPYASTLVKFQFFMTDSNLLFKTSQNTGSPTSISTRIKTLSTFSYTRAPVFVLGDGHPGPIM